MPLAPLPSSTVKLIGSSQVITSVSSVIKELMENSLDSGAHNIEIKLDKHGLEKIEVKDDGCGIGKNDVTVMCLPSYTSKILDFSDLESLSSYGFRGEALSSLCNTAQVTVTTKTDQDDVATCYTYDHNGQVICSKISHISKGTIVTVTDLFKNLPVRKQFVSSSKRAAEELKRVEKVVKSLGMIHPRLRITLIHNKFLIWQKTSVGSLRQSVMQVVNLNIVKQLHHILNSSEQIRVEMLVPKRDCDVSSICYSNFTDAYYLFINNRPVRSKEVEKTVYNKLSGFFGVYLPANKYPMCITSLEVPSNCLDVNLEPNKTRVYLRNLDEVLDFVNQCLHIYYSEGKRVEEEIFPSEKNPKRPKLEELVVESKKLNIEQVGTINTTDDCQLLGDGLIKCPDEAIDFGQGQSNLDTVTSSNELVSNQNLDLSIRDVDYSFEQSCIEREKESNTSSKSSRPTTDEFTVDINLNKDSKSSSFNKYSIFFPAPNAERFFSEEPNNDNDNSVLGSPVNQQQKTNKKIKLDQEYLECTSISSKTIVDCFKNNSEISLTARKNQIMDTFLNNTTKPISPEKKDHSNFDEQGKSFKYYDIEAEELIASNEEEFKSQNIEESCSPTLSQWSKGVVINSAGALAQGPSILVRQQQQQPESPGEPTNRSVCSQMGCKEMSAFTKFARKIRKEILEEQPQLSFTKVAQMLQVQWRHLDVDEKKKYEETVTITKCPTTSCQPSKQMSITAFISSAPNIELDISVESIQQMTGKQFMPDPEEDVRLVGRLEASHLWLYSDGRQGVFCLSASRLLEAVRYHQQTARFALPSKLLDENVIITPRDLSVTEWELLLSLKRSPNGIIMDNRFTDNGFVLEILKGDAEAHLSYVPQNVAYSGTEEVQEILKLLLTHGSNASLAHCRPLKILSFIRSEVMRLCSREDPPTQPQQVSELLSYWLSHVVQQSQDCIHHRPVTQALLCP